MTGATPRRAPGTARPRGPRGARPTTVTHDPEEAA